MKLKSLHIDSHKHLQNLHFDFVYPEGHAKAGQPLDKICIIGQSATGKTSILELIKNNTSEFKSIEIVDTGERKYFFGSHKLNFQGYLEYLFDKSKLKITEDKIIKDDTEYINPKGGVGGSISYLIPENVKLLYLSSEIIVKETINIFNQNPINILNDLTNDKKIQIDIHSLKNYVYEFVQDINLEIWLSLLYKILDYRKRFTQMASELINKGAIGDLKKLNDQYARWSRTNENPLVLFAKYFDPILNKLNLEVDLVNTEFSIPIKSTIKEEVIPISNLSTGTKSLLFSMFPLFELDTTNSIILIDEPERSLFPDIQIDLISYYENLAPNAQFIVATHSPFIAAAFEPEERFILYFDEAGNVAVRRGESPIGDDPNDMLKNDFKVSYYNDFGKAAYEKYLDLKTKLNKETELEKKKQLVTQLSELGDKYNF